MEASTSNQGFYFINSQRSGKLLVRNGFEFRHDGKFPNNGNRSYKCSTSNCKARLTINQDRIISESNLPHSHPVDGNLPDKILQQEFHTEANRIIKDNPNMKLRSIHSKIGQNVSKKTKFLIDQMPSFDSMKSSINRKKQNINPVEAQNARDLIIDENWKITDIEVEKFLQIDEIIDGQRVLVFYKKTFVEDVLTHIDKPIMFVDGTFKSSAKMFKQSFTIHFTIQDHGVPAIYCLLEDKKESTYQSLFTLIKSALDLTKIETVMVDFEIAIHNALRNVFPNIKVKGCWFHFTQAIMKKVRKMGLMAKYNKNAKFKSLVQNLFDLVLVPITEISSLFKKIKNSMMKLDEEDKVYQVKLNGFLNYCSSTWFNENSRFSSAVWNHFKSTVRTNNFVEG